MIFRQRRAGLAIKRFMKRVMARRRYARAVFKRRQIGRAVMAANPMPTFTETFQNPQQPVILGNAGGNFQVNIGQIPQIAQYFNLYRQYRINWVKVMIFPELAGDVGDVNMLYAQNNAGGNAAGRARIAFAINDTPGLPLPANEGDVLQDNGCRVQSLGSKWSVSFKPVVDQQIVSGGVASVGTRLKQRSWLNFAVAPNIDPTHYGVSYWISHYVGIPSATTYKVYYKVNFTLRDAK